MPSTTSFEEFIRVARIEGVEDAYWLQEAVQTGEDMDDFHVVRRDDKMFVSKRDIELVLVLASGDAEVSFCRVLDKTFAPTLGLESEFNLRRQMEKDD